MSNSVAFKEAELIPFASRLQYVRYSAAHTFISRTRP